MTRPKASVLVAVAVMGAVAFVLLRMLYRILFGGAATGEIVLWSLPRLRLSGPFSHIVLFGPVTAEGLLQAAWSAVPFAVVILITGTVVALVDLRSLVFLIPRVRWGRATFIAFVIALATIPSIVETARRTHFFAKIRGISRRRVLFVPFLEKTLERASSLAQALHARGVVSLTPPEVSPTTHLLSLDNFSIPSRGVRDISWATGSAFLTLLTGETGTGKTSVLEACAGVLDFPHPVVTTGSLATSCSSQEVGYVPHDPKSFFLTGRVRDEIALGLVLRGVSRMEARGSAEEKLELWELSHVAERHPGDLSEGEAVLVALLSALALSPRLLLLDEPLAVLDRDRRRHVIAQLSRYVDESGAAVILTDHGHVSPQDWPGDIVQLGFQGIAPGPFVARELVFPARVDVPRPEADAVFAVDSLSVFKGGRAILEDVCLTIRRGESLVIVGDNGTGKTTLLEALLEHSAFRPSHLAYVPANPADMFVRETLADELAYADKNSGVPEGFTLATLESLLPGPWRKDMLARAKETHPRDLSRGQQTAVAIALQMSHKPFVLALDEPTRGLDHGAKMALTEVLACVQETGTAIISASHDDDFVAGGHDRLFRLAGGHLIKFEGGAVHA